MTSGTGRLKQILALAAPTTLPVANKIIPPCNQPWPAAAHGTGGLAGQAGGLLCDPLVLHMCGVVGGWAWGFGKMSIGVGDCVPFVRLWLL